MSFSTYLTKIEKALVAGNATEHTHRPALKELLESFKPKITATNEPKREECGAPDYVISEQHGHGPLTIGYVEAKDVGLSLVEVQKSEQLKRYRHYLPNLILTDYLEFRWFVDGEPRRSACLARLATGGKLKRDKKGAEETEQLIRAFLDHKPAEITKPQELAARMARLTHMIRDIIMEAIETGKASSTLTDLRKAFAQALIPDLDLPKKTADFADMYAQTIAYGLFAARCNHRGAAPFRRLGAAAEIPKTNPFLRRLFETITGADLDEEPYAGFVDDLADLLRHADMATVLEHFGKRTRRQDPVVHFYETFLAAYDPKLREARGVYYTPEPVVSYIVRSVDHLLKTRFDCPQGLADTSTCQFERPRDADDAKTETSPRVLILDPACGTGTFLYAVVDHIREQFMKTGNAGMWSGYVRNHLLPRLFGFELLMAPYAVAHFKLGMQLAAHDLESDELRKNWAYDFGGGVEDRLKVYLTNTLEGIERSIPDLFGWYKIISDEANSAREIKRDLPIMVVIGNPPYSGHSANTGTWISDLIEDYKSIEGNRIKLAQGKWLQDDYVKFLRFGQWRIDHTGAGVLAFITNHSYFDNPTFRGMRWRLMQTFTDIYLLDLHGSVKKKESCPDGSKDENVFDIQQGVAIGIFVKLPGQSGPAHVHHADLWGLRTEKYERLSEMEVESTPWKAVDPQSPSFFFVPQDLRLKAEYDRGCSIRDLMNPNGDPAPGIVTTHDQFAISWDADEAAEKVERFLKTASESEAREIWRLCSQSQWHYARAKKELASSDWKDRIRSLLYRPFDIRWTVFDSNVAVHRRERVMRHMLAGPNIALITSRLTKGESFQHVQVTRGIAEVICMSAKTSNNGFVFPLYLYPSDEGDLLQESTARYANLNEEWISEIANRVCLSFLPDELGDLQKTFGPEDVFHYVYAVLHSPTYRARYAGFLRRDFPRVPLTSDKELFRLLCELGSQLVALHLLESPLLVPPDFITRYPVSGDNLVEKGHPKYLAPGELEPGTGKPLADGRVYISKDKPRENKQGQYFEGVPPEVWEFHVGGYQVCEKWLKDRRGRTLSYDDLTHYQKVVLALKETIRLMAEIDAAIPSWPIR